MKTAPTALMWPSSVTDCGSAALLATRKWPAKRSLSAACLILWWESPAPHSTPSSTRLRTFGCHSKSIPRATTTRNTSTWSRAGASGGIRINVQMIEPVLGHDPRIRCSILPQDVEFNLGPRADDVIPNRQLVVPKTKVYQNVPLGMWERRHAGGRLDRRVLLPGPCRSQDEAQGSTSSASATCIPTSFPAASSSLGGGARGDRQPEADSGRRAHRQPAFQPGQGNHGAVQAVERRRHHHRAGDPLGGQCRLRAPDHQFG